MAITKFDQFDFLIDIVPRDDLKPPKRQVGKHANTDWQTAGVSKGDLSLVSHMKIRRQS